MVRPPSARSRSDDGGGTELVGADRQCFFEASILFHKL